MIELTEREYKLLCQSLDYIVDPFGAPNHLFYELTAKLAEGLADTNDGHLPIVLEG